MYNVFCRTVYVSSYAILFFLMHDRFDQLNVRSVQLQIGLNGFSFWGGDSEAQNRSLPDFSPGGGQEGRKFGMIFRESFPGILHLQHGFDIHG